MKRGIWFCCGETQEFKKSLTILACETTSYAHKLADAKKEQGFNRDVRKIKTKIKHLCEVHRKHKDKINRSGTGGGNPPKFFEEIDVILGTRPQIQPPFVMDSGEPTSLTLENNSEDNRCPISGPMS